MHRWRNTTCFYHDANGEIVVGKPPKPYSDDEESLEAGSNRDDDDDNDDYEENESEIGDMMNMVDVSQEDISFNYPHFDQ